MLALFSRIQGRDNRVDRGVGTRTGRLVLDIIGTGNTVRIGNHCRLSGRIVMRGDNQTVEIGPSTVFKGCYLLCSEGCDIRIGRHCLFSRGTEIRTTDAHSVIDATTGERLNRPGSVEIGGHVWMGVGAMVSKGVRIAEDNIVAAGAFVNRSCSESQTVIAGAPARVTRRGVTWNRRLQDHFTSAEIDHWRMKKKPLPDRQAQPSATESSS
jgi:acetyltransferase-like isoleucine patch superfamily enzyme